MSPTEYGELVVWIEDRWPASKAWTRAEVIYPDFQHYDAKVAMAAVGALFAEGRQGAPSPSLVLGKIRELVPKSSMPRASHEHRWGNIPPSRLYSAQMGPGVKICNCTEEHPCHCADCQEDPLYAKTLRTMTESEAVEAKRRKEATMARHRARLVPSESS